MNRITATLYRKIYFFLLQVLSVFMLYCNTATAQTERLEYFNADTSGYAEVKIHKPLINLQPIWRGIGLAPSIAYPVVTISEHDGAKIDIALLAEGYTIEQMGRFEQHCNTFRKALFATYPFSIDSNRFNIYGIETPSQDSGVAHPNTAPDCFTAYPLVPVSNPHTYYSATFDMGGIHRLLYSGQQTIIRGVLATNLPTYKAVVILCNTPYYGGSGGIFACYAAGNSSSTAIALHEMCHSLYGLGDEYGGIGGCDVQGMNNAPNVSNTANKDSIRWKQYLTTDTLPTKKCGYVGAYLGANYSMTCWYRPECNCKMLNLGAPFCTVCSNWIHQKNLLMSPDIVISPCVVTPPTEVKVESTAKSRKNKGLKVSWYDVNHKEIIYRIQYRQLGGEKWMVKPNRHSTFFIRGLEGGIIYEVRVGATCKGGNGKYQYSPIIECKVR